MLNKNTMGVKKFEANKKQYCKWCNQSFDNNWGQEVIHQKSDRLRLLTMSSLSVSVDKRDTMKLYNKLHTNTTKIVVALHKKFEVIFTGLSFNGIAKMQRYTNYVVSNRLWLQYCSIAQHYFVL